MTPLIQITPKRILAGLLLALVVLTGATVTRHPANGPIVHTIVLGMNPTNVAVDGVTGHAFIVDRNTNGYAALGQGTVRLVDTRAGTLLHAAPVGPDPREAVIDARNGRVLVANDDDSSVSILDARSGALLGVTRVGSHPHAVAVDTRTDRAFVVNSGDGSVSVLDARTDRVLRTVRLGARDFALSSIAVDEQAGRVFVADAAGGAALVRVLDARNGAIRQTNTGSSAPSSSAPSYAYPSGLYGLAAAGRLVVDPAPVFGAPGGRVFLVNSAGLSVLDARTGRALRTIAVAGTASAVAVDTRHHRLYVASINGRDANGAPAGPGRVMALDERSGTILRTVDAGMSPRGLAVDAGTGHVIVVDEGGSMTVSDAWAWIPAGLRQRLPFLNTPIRTRAVPASVVVFDMAR